MATMNNKRGRVTMKPDTRKTTNHHGTEASDVHKVIDSIAETLPTR